MVRARAPLRRREGNCLQPWRWGIRFADSCGELITPDQCWQISPTKPRSDSPVRQLAVSHLKVRDWASDGKRWNRASRVRVNRSGRGAFFRFENRSWGLLRVRLCLVASGRSNGFVRRLLPFLVNCIIPRLNFGPFVSLAESALWTGVIWKTDTGLHWGSRGQR